MRTDILVAMAAGALLAGCDQKDPNLYDAAKTPPDVFVAELAKKQILSARDLRNLATAKLAAPPDDQFSSHFDATALQGKKFELSFVPKERILLSSSEANYFYDQSTQVETIALYGEWDAQKPVQYQFWADVDKKSRRSAQNAFGAKFEVERSDLKTYSVVMPNASRSYAWSAKLDPEVARTAAASARIIIRGHLSAQSKFDMVKCNGGEMTATIDAPIEGAYLDCFLSAEIDSVELAGVPKGVTFNSTPPPPAQNAS